MINQRLFDWYGIDTTKNLGMSRRCPRPYDTILIDKNGSCYPCECVAWLPYNIGNIKKHSIAEILSANDRQIVKNSIADGSFRYCNNRACSHLQVQDPESSIFTNQLAKDQLRYIRIAIDDSCNLRCPSCRDNRIFHKNKKILQTKKQWCDQIIEYLNSSSHPIEVHIGSDGDPFASIVYRYLLTHAPNKDNVSYTLQTNGLLFEKMFHRCRHIATRLKAIHVSCDGASQHTYEKLRLGGGWNHITRNLEFLKKTKQQYNFQTLLHVVVQQDNYKELEQFVELAKQYNFDRIYFNKIQNWNTRLNFNQANVFDKNHMEYKNCQKIINQLMKKRKQLPKKFIEGTAIPY